MANLTKALAAGGAKIADVTKITIYICNPHDVPKARGLLQTYFAGAAPASTLCILRGLPIPISCWKSRRSRRCNGRTRGSAPSHGPIRPGSISHYRLTTSMRWSKVAATTGVGT
jgi:enamine deaminase RidA (YjgF/YER057c/UK114 family)